MAATTGYRADIDGLRAFAVLFVTIFHINETLIPGGFIGVDMFFVISGYLITGIIARDASAGRFSFAEFYRRRIKRIFPVMFLVTGVTLAAGVALMLPQDVEALSWSALATILSAANIYFAYFLDTSYFAADSATVPLLHMWSLGVEEQFYLFWPALLLVLLKWPRAVIPVLLAMIAVSIALGGWLLSEGSLEWAYYMLPTRAFQLAAGGLLVFLPAWASGRPPVAAGTVAAGALLCAVSAFHLTGDTLYPGLNAAPVTVGTALMILGGSTANPVSVLLMWAPLRWIGLISYSLYLWHWPVLAFQRYLTGPLSVEQQVLSLIAMLVLSWFSYRYVEEPCRRSARPLGQVALRMGVVPAAALSSAVALLFATAWIGPWALTNYPDRLAAFHADFEPASKAPYVCQLSQLSQADFDNQRCVINGNGAEPRILVWGDSNAAHYVGALRAIAEEADFSFRNVAHSACPPFLDRPERFTNGVYVNRCAASSEVVRANLHRYDAVIISAAWDGGLISKKRAEYEQELGRTIRELKAQGKAVLVLGRTPRIHGLDYQCQQKRLKVPSMRCEARTTIEAVEETNGVIREITFAAGGQYFDFSDFMCTEGVCAGLVQSLPVYLDTGHLTRQGSERLGEVAKLDSGVIALFSTFVHDGTQRQAGY